MYGVLFAWMKPIQDGVENRLMSMSLAVTVFNLGVGAVSRIPAENLPAYTDPVTDKALFKMLVLGANTLVICLSFGKITTYISITHVTCGRTNTPPPKRQLSPNLKSCPLTDYGFFSVGHQVCLLNLNFDGLRNL